jgi:Flp pilus assembly protein TadD
MTRRARMLLIVVLAFGLSACQWQEQTQSLPGAAMTHIDPHRLAAALPEPDPMFLPITHFSAAQVLEQRGDLVRAAEQYRKAVALNHDFIAAYNRLGLVLCRLGQPVPAEQAFRQAIQKRPGRAYLHNNLAYCLMLQEQWPTAETELLKALQLKGDFVRARINLGICLGKEGHYEEALAQFTEVLAPDESHYNMGLLCKSNQDYQQAEIAFRDALELNPGLTAAARQLAEVESAERVAILATIEQQAREAETLEPATETTGPSDPFASTLDAATLQSPEADLAPPASPEMTLAEALPELQIPQVESPDLEITGETADGASVPETATTVGTTERETATPPAEPGSIAETETAIIAEPVDTVAKPEFVIEMAPMVLIEDLAGPSGESGEIAETKYDLQPETSALIGVTPESWADWLLPTEAEELTCQQVLDLLWVPSSVTAPEITAQAAASSRAERTGGLFNRLLDWLRATWEGIVAACTPATILEQTETASIDVLPGPGCFDYPSPWSWQLDWTRLASGERESPRIRQPLPQDWTTVFHHALPFPEDDELVYAWLRQQQ